MKRITQAEYDALPIIDGIRQCPGGMDYRDIMSFGERAWFVEGAWFGERAWFVEGAWLVERASFVERTSFGERAKIEGHTIIGNAVYSAGGFGSANRTTYGIPTRLTLYIRCGCWLGTIAQFRQRIADVYSSSPIQVEYALLADLFEARWKREKGEGQ